MALLLSKKSNMPTKSTTTMSKKVAVKKAGKTVKVKAAVEKKTEETVTDKKSVQLTVLGIDGKAEGKVSVPSMLFAAKANPTLVSQAVRVYLANQREGSASTKTRSEVAGSTRKIYRQKGTGRARHGGIRAPIFVGGGISFGPKPRSYHLALPQKMKRAALACALTGKREDGNVIVVNGLTALKPKTKLMVKALINVGATKKPLLVVGRDADMVIRASRNIDGIEIMPVQNLHTYAILAHPKIVFMKEALPILTETFVK